MSLSLAATEQPSGQRPTLNGLNGAQYSPYESDLLKKSAEAGMPAAQLALAQLHLTRRSNPQDMVEAYKWYLIATECAMQARGFITKMLTTEQIEEAKRKASSWLARRKQKSAAASAPSPSKQPLSAGPESLIGRRGTEFHKQAAGSGSGNSHRPKRSGAPQSAPFTSNSFLARLSSQRKRLSPRTRNGSEAADSSDEQIG